MAVKERPVTMSEIANRLNISRSTVSYVLSGTAKSKQISQDTIEKVKDVANELNYVPNRLAQNLSRRRTGVISLLFGELSYDWAECVIKGGIPVFDAAAYTAFIGVSLREAARQDKEITAIIERRDEGVICCPLPWGASGYKKLIERGIPFVFTGDTLLEMTDVSFVAWDVGPATEIAVQHLIKTGRRKIGMVGSDYPTWSTNIRSSVFSKVLKDAGLQVRNDWVGLEKAGLSPDRVIDVLFKKGMDHPDALYVMDDSLALLTLDKLNKMGLKIPDDVAVIGMGDLRESSHSMIGLTTVAEPTQEMGKIAAETIIELIRKPQQSPIKRLLSGTDLKIRRTA
ncbi:MAG: Transcriptional regulator, LacI family [Parcubacteria group bacterium GW2011_GWA2_43_17]|nr:MAG: Transcriptional regulator, LacI family [Parcubacteria group bacterium GW2011_GWA2_43_17]OHB42127.1 MAG: hypothetical protein A2Y13_07430 [Planctomycetes bacterium GWC2_45_44]